MILKATAGIYLGPQMTPDKRRLCLGLLIGPLAAINSTMAQPRPTPPTRDPHTPGYVSATELPDGAVPSPDRDGNYIIGPTHAPAAEMAAHDRVPRGTIHTFTMRSADSKLFPGIARDSGTFGTVSPTDPATLVVTTSHPAPSAPRCWPAGTR